MSMNDIMEKYPTQWYNINPGLFRIEVAAMRKFSSKAGFSFMKSTGQMYWIIDLDKNMYKFEEDWRLLTLYASDHGLFSKENELVNKRSIKVFPIRPKEENLENTLEEKNQLRDNDGKRRLLRDIMFGSYFNLYNVSYDRSYEQDCCSVCSAMGYVLRAIDWIKKYYIVSKVK